MGLCDLCGEKAGWLQSRHPACDTRAAEIGTVLHELILNGALAGKTYAELNAEAEQIAVENKLPIAHFRETLLQAANDAATQLALQSPVTEGELNRLAEILLAFGIEAYATEWPERRWFGMSRLGMSHTLWRVFHDTPPFYLADDGDYMQFNLQAGELPVCKSRNITFAQERTVSTRTYSGLSLPIGSGIYYHFGSSQGDQASGLLPLDVGDMLITTHAIYFGGQKTTLRIPLNHVIRYQPYTDGVGVCESHGAPKVFKANFGGADTGWFLFNLLSALTSKLTR